MIVKKKHSGVAVVEEVTSQPKIETKVISDLIENDFYHLAESFKVNYKGLFSLVDREVPASKIVDQLEEIGNDLAAKLNEEFPNKEIRKEMVKFTKSTFSTIGEKIQETFPFDDEPIIRSLKQEHDVLKIGICSGILSGIASYIPNVETSEK